MATYSAEQRKDYAKRGIALPDGSYPIPNRAALADARQAYGRANESDRARVAAHIRKRAAALGVSLNDSEFAAGPSKKSADAMNGLMRGRRHARR